VDDLGRWINDGPLGTASWIDAVDVLLLAIAIYLSLRVLRGTRAFQSLVGLLLLAGVYLFSAAVGLSTLHWVLDSLFVYAVLALLILFQEDIRRVLAQAGGTVFASRARREIEDVALIEEIVKATFQLANRRIGALVAIERTASLSTYAEAGQLLDAVTSNELLQALFHPSSPVHDGAVVIHEGRIERAGVFLPLSMARNLPKVYGPRHRAAVGISEVTDALVVIVSEERGTVAVVTDGTVTPVADPNDLRQMLQALLRAQPEEAASKPTPAPVSSRPPPPPPPSTASTGSAPTEGPADG